MPELTRQYCSRCQQSIYNCMIEGQRIPLVMRLVIGQPGDTGAPLDLNAPGVKVPSFVRALMRTPIARIELCMSCAATVLGVPVLAAGEDPALVDANGNGIPDVLEIDNTQPLVEQLAAMHAPVFTAIRDAHEALVAEAVTKAVAQYEATTTVDTATIIEELRATVTPSVDAPVPEAAAEPVSPP